MAFNIIKSCENIKKIYKRYLKTTFDIKDEEYRRKFHALLDNKVELANGPYLQVNDSFVKGRNVKQLIDDGILSKDFSHISRLYNIPALHLHQEQSLLKIEDGHNLIVSTGTGSGKTECFCLPIINELMREKEKYGHITKGVRAIIIFPMNALVNDQMDRLRKLFIDYPDITFGHYTGQTKRFTHCHKNLNEDATEAYKKLNGERIDDVRLRTPLPNEILSREDINKNPPHILVTNYAMLEHLLLRPADDAIFNCTDENTWKFIVLDEAHTYMGSSAIEVSMLLRRLKTKVSRPNIQFILTSATLGNDDTLEDVASFGSNLCSSPFTVDDIVQSTRVNLIKEKNESSLKDIPIDFYKFVEELVNTYTDSSYIINQIEDKYHFNINKEQTINEYLFDVLMCDKFYWSIKELLKTPASIYSIGSTLKIYNDDLSSFINVASVAEKNYIKLFDAKYHMFLKATDGIFVTLGKKKNVYLNRQNDTIIDGEDYKVYEIATCTHCHAMYLLGYIKDNYLVQNHNYSEDNINEAFLIAQDYSDTDIDNLLKKQELKVEKYLLCPHCGLIQKADLVTKLGCEHNEDEYITLFKVVNANRHGRVTKCIDCENINRMGILRPFFSGQEASTAVIGTALFNELPQVKVTKIIPNSDENDDPFGFDIELKEEETVVTNEARQFLAFSDNRQGAAYYASYLSTSHENILYNHALLLALNSISVPCTYNKLKNKLALILEKNNIAPFYDYLERNCNISSNNYDFDLLAGKIIYRSIVNSNLKNSIVQLGLLGFQYNLDADDIMTIPAIRNLNLTNEDVETIIKVIINYAIQDNAIDLDFNLNPEQRQLITLSPLSSYSLNGSSNVKDNVIPFIPHDPNSHYSNKRLDYITRLLTKLQVNSTFLEREKLIEFLISIWKNILTSFHVGQRTILNKCTNNNSQYRVRINDLIFSNDFKLYRCKKCHKITCFNSHNVCPSYHCDGELEEIDPTEVFKDNHYYLNYKDNDLSSLRVCEHTAQLKNDLAYKYQTYFKDKKIDVLSCSTTFEMGVDIGDLETVFMRNMPPSTANYTQRAGRAGRGPSSAAFVLTYCNRSNHDFNFFKKPDEMINGRMNPPVFKKDNPKICIRHLYSVVFSFFFKKYPMMFATAKEFVYPSEVSHVPGYDLLSSYLHSKPKELKDFLKNVFSTMPTLYQSFDIDNFGWVDYLLEPSNGDYTSLFDVVQRFMQEIDSINQLKIDQPRLVNILDYRLKTYMEEDIIDFLSRNNILPKYGFPVDTVTLDKPYLASLKSMNNVDLSLGMEQGISKYAPGSEVIANNRIFTSRYINKIPGKEWKMYNTNECRHCHTLNVAMEGESFDDCKFCREKLDRYYDRTFIIPEFGFLCEPKDKIPSLIKPENTYSTEASFVKYLNDINETIIKLGDYEARIASISDGPMVMLNKSNFYVCPTCGYAEVIEEINGNRASPYKTIEHKNSNGYPCHCGLVKRTLGYQFNTDVVKVIIPNLCNKYTDLDELKNVYYSVLQALLISACNVLHISDREISGCLQYNSDINTSRYSFIFYDKTPGGAGHVQRILDSQKFIAIIKYAYNLVNSCKCGGDDGDSSCYDCIRTYGNKNHHEDMKRKYVIDYLKPIIESIENGRCDSDLERAFNEGIKNIASSFEPLNNELGYQIKFDNISWKFKSQEPIADVEVNTLPDFTFIPEDGSKTILVYLDGYTYHNNQVNKDMLKRDKLLLSNKYEVWNLTYKDVQDYHSSMTLDFSNNDILNNNQFGLLIYRLSDNNSLSKLKECAQSIGEKIDIKDELNQRLIESLTNFNLGSSIIDCDTFSKEIDNNILKTYKVVTSNESIILNYINDLDINITSWSMYLALNNVLQYTDKFIALTEKGLRSHDYDNISGNINIVDDKWMEIISMISDNDTLQFIKKCREMNIIHPDEVGFELDDGSVAELAWLDLKIVYLTSYQLDNKDGFINNEYRVVTNIDELIDLMED